MASRKSASDAPAAMRTSDAHAFNLSPAYAGAAEAMDNGKLQATGNLPIDLGEKITIARLRGHAIEGVAIGFGQGIDRLLAALSQPIVGQHPHDCRQVVTGRGAKRHICRRHPVRSR